MRAVVSGEHFSWALSRSVFFSANKSPLFDYIEISARKSGGIFVTSHGDAGGIRVSLPSSDTIEGRIVVTRGQVERIASVIPKEVDIELSVTTAGHLMVEASSSKIGLLKTDNVEIAPWPGTPPGREWVVAEGIEEQISAVAWAGDPNDEYSFKGGVLISPEKVEATNGHVLARSEPGPIRDGTALVPIKSIQRLGALSYTGQPALRMLVDESRVWFFGGMAVAGAPTWIAFFTQVNSKFPDTSQMIFTEQSGVFNPRGEPYPVSVQRSVPRREFADKAGRLYAASSETFQADAIFEAIDGELRMSSSKGGDIRVSETAPIRPHEQLHGLRVGSQYLKRSLDRIPSDNIDVLWGLSFVSGQHTLIELKGEEQSPDGVRTYTTLIMPRTQ